MHYNRSLGRGLKMLAVLNAAGEHRVASLARAVDLPRSTAFRILCTLVEQGYVRRDPATDRYHPTALVLALSDGFDATARLVQAAEPVVTELGRQLVWPVMLATLSGTSALLRQCTDAANPRAVVRNPVGCRTPLVDRATGLVLLAFTNPEPRRVLMDMIYREEAAERPIISRAEAERRVTDVRAAGFACLHQPGDAAERSSLAVPVRAGPDALATVAVRFSRHAVSRQVVMDRFLPALRRAAHGIVERTGSRPSAPTIRATRAATEA
jgi:IclR family mhp operon transcriptional activator